MSLFAVLAALALEYRWPERPEQPRRRAGDWLAWLLENLNAGGEQHGALAWTLGALLPALVVAGIAALLGGLWHPLGWVFDVVVLYFCLGFKAASFRAAAVMRTLDGGDTEAARTMLKRTRLAISLTPMPECLPALPDTIAWFKARGIDALTMSPTLYNRGGNLADQGVATRELRQLIKRHKLRSQELDFVPGARDIYRQWRHNRYKCLPRNVDLFVASSGEYLYCYNDVGHRHAIGNVVADSIGDTLRRRQGMAAIASLCGGCNMRDRYGAAELARAGVSYMRSLSRLAA